MARSLRTVALKVIAPLLVVAALATATAGPATAMNPPQTTTAGVINLLGGTSSWSIRNFWTATLPTWGYRYSTPKLAYYTAPRYCGNSYLALGNSFWCATDWTIYLDKSWNQGIINTYGDFGSGGILAHEWGHAIDTMTGRTYKSYLDEYHADCYAGLYYRWGYTGGRLLASDFNEFYSWLYYQPQSASHGYGPNRAAWFQWGYSQYTRAACDQVYAGTAARTTASPGLAGTSSAGPVWTVAPAPKRGQVPAGARVVRPGELPVGSGSSAGSPARS